MTMSNETVWVVDDDRSIRWVLEKALVSAGLVVEVFEEANSVLKALEKKQPDAIVSDIRMPGIDGLELLSRIHKRYPQMPVIIITAHSDLDSAVSAYQGGAFEYLPKPFDTDEAVELVKRAVKHNQNQENKSEAPNFNTPEIIGEAASMQEVFRAIGRLSHSNITVLINGQSGTGKELVAHALHRHSPRSTNPFIALNMAAIPRDLMESELFGHERGSFTGAQAARKGRFEQANGGTLFLDEIGDMPAELQTRLLRVLSDGEYYRVGGHDPVKSDVRIIAATHQNLEQRVKEGSFREDLFHRLNVIRIQIPKLSERREDIPVLANHFLNVIAEELNVEAKVLDEEVLQFLLTLEWPGNVRQLENTCRWITVMSPGKMIHLDGLPAELSADKKQASKITTNWVDGLREWANHKLQNGDEGILEIAQQDFERTLIESALNYSGGRRQDAAKLLGWGRNTLTRKIKDLKLDE